MSEEDCLVLEDHPPKRIKIDNEVEEEADKPKEEKEEESKPKSLVDPTSRLSKFARRLFDPDRTRGLIETPEIIPLNDEFLTQFGKREKEYDEKIGRKLDSTAGENLDEAVGADDETDSQDDGDDNTGPKEETGFKVCSSFFLSSINISIIIDVCIFIQPIIISTS